MAQISIADELLNKVENSLSDSVSAEQFVADAVREKLAWHEKQTEFYELSDETHQLMQAKGIAEAEILSDFEAFREGLTSD